MSGYGFGPPDPGAGPGEPDKGHGEQCRRGTAARMARLDAYGDSLTVTCLAHVCAAVFVQGMKKRHAVVKRPHDAPNSQARCHLALNSSDRCLTNPNSSVTRPFFNISDVILRVVSPMVSLAATSLSSTTNRRLWPAETKIVATS